MEFGRLFIIIGIVLVVIGVIYTIFPNGGGFPKLPGDILVRRGNFTFYFPIVTSIIISVILTIILHFFFRR
jgi:hypothetical protein